MGRKSFFVATLVAAAGILLAGCGGGGSSASANSGTVNAPASGVVQKTVVSQPFQTIVPALPSAIGEKRLVAVRDEAAWNALWAQHAGDGPRVPEAPAVDFTRNMVIGVFLGARNYCDGVAILAVKQKTNPNRVEVTYRESTPGPEMACIALVGNPAVLVTVPYSSDPVEFVQAPSSANADLLIRSGWSFGMCLDNCEAAVEIGKDGATFRAVSGRGDRGGVPYQERAIWGEVSAQEWQALTAAAKTMPAADTVLGCPDCADGGAEWIEIEQAGKKTKVSFSCREGIPGAEAFQGAVRSIRTRVAAALGMHDPCSPDAVAFDRLPGSVFTSEIEDKRFVTIRDAAAWAVLWREHAAGRAELPVVDFSQEMVLGVFLGGESITCGSMSIETVTRRSNPERLEVGYRVVDPGPNVMCIAANINQYSLVKVPASSSPVEFVKLP
ncbi:MAG TPA: hypothetical protein VEC06_04040 [Paucimonas sp.]|nr:hypothetical protein [Paucimonas sp.]